VPIDASVYQNLGRAPSWATSPEGVLGLIRSVNDIRQFNRQYDTDTAIGDSLKGANGNPGNALGSLIRDPRATGNLAPAISALQNARTAGYTADTTQLGRDAEWTHQINNFIGSRLADRNDLKRTDITGALATIAAMYPNIPTDKILQHLQTSPAIDDPKLLKAWANEQRKAAQGAAATGALAEGPTNVLGVPTVITAGEALDRASGTGFARGLPAGAAEAANNVRQSVQTFPTRVQPLERMVEILSHGGPGFQGLGSKELAEAQNLLNFISGGKIPKYADDAAAIEELNKYYSRRGSDVGAAGSTNAFLAQNITGNPRLEVTPKAAYHLARADLAQERALQASHREAIGQNVPAAELQDWLARHRQTQDTRAFAVDLMTPEARKKLVSGLSRVRRKDAQGNPIPGTSERERFAASHDTAERTGVFRPLDLGNYSP
jgi:hypothetical protein